MSIVQKLKMSYSIPFEIQAEIMKRLPIKSLIRFTSVSKAWRSFIHSSDFMADYNACRSQHCLLVTCADYNFKETHELIVDDDTFPLRKLSHTIPSSVNLITAKVAMFGSSQGLFCYYGYTDQRGPMAVIWNPSVRKSVDIVVPTSDGYYEIVVGFGVCPRTFDPKLVKITYIETVMQVEDDAMQVEVFTLSSEAWKSLSINLPRESIRFTQDSVDLDGFIYWHAYDHDQEDYKHNIIMSFDITSEKFTEISLPGSLLNAKNLSIYKRMESLVVLDSFYMAEKQVYKVWMMEGGVEKSFTKLFTIEAPEASIIDVLGFRKSGEPIIEMDNNGSYPDKLGVYHYKPNSRHISYAGISAGRYFDLAGSCTNTLLLIDR